MEKICGIDFANKHTDSFCLTLYLGLSLKQKKQSCLFFLGLGHLLLTSVFMVPNPFCHGSGNVFPLILCIFRWQGLFFSQRSKRSNSRLQNKQTSLNVSKNFGGWKIPYFLNVCLCKALLLDSQFAGNSQLYCICNVRLMFLLPNGNIFVSFVSGTSNKLSAVASHLFLIQLQFPITC